MTSQALNVGYIVESYSTFIVNEISELRKQGANITVFSAFRPVPESDPVKDAIRTESLYFPEKYRGVFSANLMVLLVKPYTYVKLALFLLREKEGVRMLILATYFSHVILKNGIKHIHSTFGTRTATLAYLISKLSGIDYSFTTHAYDIFNPNPSLVWKTNHSRFMRTISKYNKKFIEETYKGIDKEKIIVNYLGVNLLNYSIDEVRKKNTNQFRIVSVGNLVPKKGHSYLIKACKMLVEKYDNVFCDIIGNGPMYQTLQNEIKELKLEHNVRLLGALSNIEVHLQLADSQAFVLFCTDMRDQGEHVDGIPVALMEAMAIGVPVISTKLSGIPELIEDEVSGLLVSDKDIISLVNAIEKLIRDVELRNSLGRYARKRIEDGFDLKTNTKELAERFQAVSAS